jgi:predicted small secreted protein
MMRLMTVLVLAAVFGAIVGCNTVQGVGRDIEAAGKGIQRGTR